MEFYNKYRHIGYSFLGVPTGWQPIVKEVLIKIEKIMWPQWWLPMFVKRWIHWLATGNSVVRVKFWFWLYIRRRLTGGMMVTDVKDKYASLRIYGLFSDEVDKLIDEADDKCQNTCEVCGSDNGTLRDDGWMTIKCDECYGNIKRPGTDE